MKKKMLILFALFGVLLGMTTNIFANPGIVDGNVIQWVETETIIIDEGIN